MFALLDYERQHDWIPAFRGSVVRSYTTSTLHEVVSSGVDHWVVSGLPLNPEAAAGWGRAVLRAIEAARPTRVTWVSSTAVYGLHQTDACEAVAPEPDSPFGMVALDCEARLVDLVEHTHMLRCPAWLDERCVWIGASGMPPRVQERVQWLASHRLADAVRHVWSNAHRIANIVPEPVTIREVLHALNRPVLSMGMLCQQTVLPRTRYTTSGYWCTQREVLQDIRSWRHRL